MRSLRAGELEDLKLKSKEGKTKAVLKTFDKYFGQYIDHDKVPEGLNLNEIITGLIATGDRDPLSDFTWKLLMVGGMHFQDLYNYDIERVKRCVVHYVVPDGRIIPFCAYNTGPEYRTEVEEKFSLSFDEYRERHGGKISPEGDVE